MNIRNAMTLLGLLAVFAGGCTTTGTVQDKTQAPCATEPRAARSGYEVAREVSCAAGDSCCTEDFPVSYRSKSGLPDLNRVENTQHAGQPTAP